MANYSNNEKATQLDVLTSLAGDDVIVVGDTSDSGKAKAISTTDLKTAMESGLVNATATDTTPDFLDSKIIFISSDSSVTITKTITNAGMDEVISYDLKSMGGGGTGGGGSLSRLVQTFDFNDFSGTTHADFTDALPEDAVPIGVIYEMTSPFDSGINLDVVTAIVSGVSLSPTVDGDVTGTRVGLSDAVSVDFSATPNPVFRASSIPTQGEATVTILYGTDAETSISACTTNSVCPSSAVSPVQLNVNTVMTVGLVDIPYAITVDTVTVAAQSVATNGTVSFALYSADGATRIINGVTGSISSSGAWQAHITPVKLSPGYYYAALHSNSTGDLQIFHTSLDADLQNFTSVGGGQVFAGTLAITASTTPATIDPESIAVSNNVPLLRFDQS